MTHSTYTSPFSQPALRELEDFLAAQDFRPFLTPRDHSLPGFEILWQKRLPDSVRPVCHLNKKLYINITLFEVPNSSFRGAGSGPEFFDSVSAEICGQLPDTQWVKLQLYSLTAEDVRLQLDKLTDKLVAAWRAMAALSPVAAVTESA